VTSSPVIVDDRNGRPLGPGIHPKTRPRKKACRLAHTPYLSPAGQAREGPLGNTFYSARRERETEQHIHVLRERVWPTVAR